MIDRDDRQRAIYVPSFADEPEVLIAKPEIVVAVIDDPNLDCRDVAGQLTLEPTQIVEGGDEPNAVTVGHCGVRHVANDLSALSRGKMFVPASRRDQRECHDRDGEEWWPPRPR